jgi:5-bromo-4-chloroindolyl phosphate hydrolysis protein
MRTVKLSPRQAQVLDSLTPRELRTLRKYPKLLREGKQLIRACKKVIKQIEALHQYANARKRATAYRRIVKVCEKAIERVER